MIRIACVLLLACATALVAQQSRPTVTNPAVLQQVKPDFSKCHVLTGESFKSRVVVSLRIREDGTADLVSIDAGSGNACFDEEALRVVKLYKFRPAMKDGQPVATTIQMAVEVQISKNN